MQPIEMVGNKHVKSAYGGIVILLFVGVMT